MQNDDNLDKAWRYISNVKKRLENENRFFTDSLFLDSLKNIFDDSTVSIPIGSKFYRSRIYTSEDKNEKKKGTSLGETFEGYDAVESFVNKSNKWPHPGRMNPAGISVLYVASDIETSVKELHPSFEELMSVATITNAVVLKIADLSKCSSNQNDIGLQMLSVYVQEIISQGNSDQDYIFPQFIASYCKKLGFDGIGYRSKYATRTELRTNKSGINYAIFNYENCEAISSKLYRVTRVSTGIKPLGNSL